MFNHAAGSSFFVTVTVITAFSFFAKIFASASYTRRAFSVVLITAPFCPPVRRAFSLWRAPPCSAPYTPKRTFSYRWQLFKILAPSAPRFRAFRACPRLLFVLRSRFGPPWAIIGGADQPRTENVIERKCGTPSFFISASFLLVPLWLNKLRLKSVEFLNFMLIL